MQHQTQDRRHHGSAKPPAAGGGSRMARTGGRRSSINGRGNHSTTGCSSNNSSKGLTVVLYGIQDSCGLPSGDKLRRQKMMKEILMKKALAPPPKRFTLRWKNFQPTPSRLSIMSMA